jgi:(2Fe-2S) ferredoxin
MLEIIGQFIGYELADGYKIKRLQLLTHQDIQSIQLAKSAKAALFRLGEVMPVRSGDLLKLIVESKISGDQVKYKAYDVQRLDEAVPINTAVIASPLIRVHICDRGTCRKRGSGQVYQSFFQAVKSADLGSQVQIETVGCLKQCQQGTNVKINDTCYSQVKPEDTEKLLEHFLPAPC